jgi:hypothetical protein
MAVDGESRCEAGLPERAAWGSCGVCIAALPEEEMVAELDGCMGKEGLSIDYDTLRTIMLDLSNSP